MTVCSIPEPRANRSERNSNEYRTAFDRHQASGASREELIHRFAFAVPTTEALDAIAGAAVAGVVEIGAGTGYWARLLADRGVDVIAYDVDPPPSLTNPWFAGSEPWFPVRTADHLVVREHPDRVLLVVWPTRNETWPVEALDLYAAEGGKVVIYVGEGPGGATGDDAFQSRLGELRTCQHCRSGVVTVACICGHPVRWRCTRRVELPHWPGFDDDLSVYEPSGSHSAKPRRSRWGRR